MAAAKGLCALDYVCIARTHAVYSSERRSADDGDGCSHAVSVEAGGWTRYWTREVGFNEQVLRHATASWPGELALPQIFDGVRNEQLVRRPDLLPSGVQSVTYNDRVGHTEYVRTTPPGDAGPFVVRVPKPPGYMTCTGGYKYAAFKQKLATIGVDEAALVYMTAGQAARLPVASPSTASAAAAAASLAL